MARWAKNLPIRNKNCLWRPCLLMDQAEMSNLYRGPSSSFGWGVSEEKIKMWKVNGRQTPSDGKSSHCLWQGKLKTQWVLAQHWSLKILNRGISQSKFRKSRKEFKYPPPFHQKADLKLQFIIWRDWVGHLWSSHIYEADRNCSKEFNGKNCIQIRLQIKKLWFWALVSFGPHLSQKL